MNCALCHTTAVRGPGEVTPRLYPAGPSQQLNPQGYLRFLFACAHDDRFTADVLLGEIEYDVKLSPVQKALYRYVLIPQTRKALLELEQQYAWMAQKPDWGRGRIDPFNPVKVNVLKMAPDDTIGNADMPPLWNMKAHDGYAYHWDGMNSKIHDVVLSSAIGDGATKDTIDLAGLQRVQDYLMKVPVPAYPFSKDTAKAEKGRPIYEQKCAECHAFGGARTGKVVKVDEVGTDGQRHRLWTDEAARRYNAFAAGYPWKFDGFRGTDGPDGGYVSVPLDGIWLRAPYLHNGSVPTLRDLLKPPARRPTQFWRGSDRYDPQAVGFDTTSEEARQVGTFFDTGVPGNGNGGHIYGTDLTEDEKDALVEYLKTL
jgi:mono/diheme cytochrome c family protein